MKKALSILSLLPFANTNGVFASEPAKRPNVIIIYAWIRRPGMLWCKERKDPQREQACPEWNKVYQRSCRGGYQHPFALLVADRRICLAQARHRRGSRQCSHDNPPHPIHHGRYVQKPRICHRSFWKMASGIRRRNRRTRLECAPAGFVGRPGM